VFWTGTGDRMISCNWTVRSRCVEWLAAMSVTMLLAWADQNKLFVKLKELRVPTLAGRTPTYYSPGHTQHAEKLQSAVDDMNAFFKERLDVQDIVLAVLDSNGWMDVTGDPYGTPRGSRGIPTVICMPATSGSPAFGLMMARKEAIPPDPLK